VTEEELLAFLRREIPERVALPKHVRFVDAMPLTAVGKIYKPALRRREAKDALEAALREAGVAFYALEIADQGPHATAARVSIDESAAQRTREVLGRFTIPFTVACRVG
jgi:fatty-acyl-CoA synthase